MTNKNQILNLKKPIRILLSILFFVLFSWGAVALSESEKYKETIVVNKIAPSDNLNKVDEIKTEIPQVDNTKLIEFQKTWSDSVVKSWKGKFIIASKLSLPDTISFELSKDATKSFNSNKSESLPMYLFSYKNSIKNKFGNEFNSIATTIDFIPNKELLKNNNPNDWTHPILKNSGLKIFGGNEYSKEFVGTLQCKYKDESNGNTYYILYKNNGSDVRIIDYEFDNYWVKKKDADSRIGIGIPKCY
ncbi:hypothetical protein [Flavobacterium davisii]|uniref:hypothetical protein n=1 Tax=Flavobacterium davisii TaxID=2906077 RepID=UPI000F50AB38|nr:hypothetical protein [Flavobacterium davisii]